MVLPGLITLADLTRLWKQTHYKFNRGNTNTTSFPSLFLLCTTNNINGKQSSDFLERGDTDTEPV